MGGARRVSLRKKKSPEPINLGFTHNTDGAVLYVEDAVSGEILFNITLAPEIARDAASKLTWHSMKAEELRDKPRENPPG
jgi:hypothetical protein